MKQASEKQKRFLFHLGVPPKIIKRLSAQAAWVIGHDLIEGTATSFGDADIASAEQGMIAALLAEGFLNDMVMKFSPNTGRILLDLFAANVSRCPHCGSVIVND